METQPLHCSEIRNALLGFMSAQTEVYESADRCVVTLPLKTVDDRWIDVHIERRNADFFVVHDAGRTVSELISHGVNITDTKTALLVQIARTFGATLIEKTFKIGAKVGGLQEAIMNIAQCATLSTLELLKHQPNYIEEPLYERLATTLSNWSANKATLQRRVKVKGKTAQHEFDFVAHPRRAHQNVIAVTVLRPSYTSMITAQRFGFLSLDLQKTEYGKWKRLAVLAHGDEWTPDSTVLISKHAQSTVRVESVEMNEIESDVPRAMNKLIKLKVA